MADLLADSRYSASLARPLARFQFLLSAVVGFSWGPLLFHFFREVVDWGEPALLIVTVSLTVGLALLGARAPMSYFRLRPWERSGRGRIYVRYFGIRWFKRWMSHGDRMNAWMRRRVPEYRIVRPTSAAAGVYAARTVEIERQHLAWGLAAIPPIIHGLSARAYGFVFLLTVVNAVTNVWPILLQRFNRVRAERAARYGDRD